MVTAAYRDLQKALPEVGIYYAIKSNPDARLARHIISLGGSFEIASATEMDMLRENGVKPADLLFTNPVKMINHIKRAHAAGVWRYAFDSHAEVKKLAEHAPGAAVFIRIVAPQHDSAVPSEGKFGVNVTDAVELMAAARDHGLRPYGIAFHVGSQMETPLAWTPAIREAAKLMRMLQEQNILIEMLDIGGGFPGFYGKELPSIAEYGAHITRALKENVPYKVRVVAEPGRYIAAKAGVLTTTVIGVARRGSKTWLHLDVGAFNGMMEALETQNTLHFPVTDSRNAANTARYNLTGPSCDSQDSILFDVSLSEGLAVGDTVYIHSTGAYTTCYASTFNGFSIPQTFIKAA